MRDWIPEYRRLSVQEVSTALRDVARTSDGHLYVLLWGPILLMWDRTRVKGR